MVQLVTATDLLGLGGELGEEGEHISELERCRLSFRHFLRYWNFVHRETGEVGAMTQLWQGQEELAELMEQERRIFALKAGKLGFTELACAFDGWSALFGQRNARVHIFSKDASAAQELLGYVRFGLTHLPRWMRVRIMADASGGDTIRSLKLRAGTDDVRAIVSYPASRNVAVDQTATHNHVDELAHMPFPQETWIAIQTTIAPLGSCHIVTRGAGDDNFAATLWEACQGSGSYLTPFFAPWTARPRPIGWREDQESSLPAQKLLHFAPESPEDALAGEDTAIYIPIEVWDLCRDDSLPPLQPGGPTYLVLGVDAAVTGDMFAVVAVSRHPNRHQDPAIRGCRVWDPGHHGGRIDFEEVERFVRFVCQGGCPAGHPKSMPLPGCQACTANDWSVPGHRVVQLAYDPYQMEEMAQRLRRDRVAWCKEFNQGSERLIADAAMHQLALRRALAHDGDGLLREHIQNARARLSKDEDSKMRIVKRSPGKKIDLAVAASMAVHRAMQLNL